MRATITANGTLKVTPENEMESWALKTWFENYTGVNSATRVMLSVEDVVMTRGEPQK